MKIRKNRIDSIESWRALRLTLCLVLPLVATACGGSGGKDASPALLSVEVDAALGGTFVADDKVKVTIPAGALSADATLTVRRAEDVTMPSGTLQAASAAFEIALDGATLEQPMMLEITADTAPVHPRIGEIAQLRGGQWQRLSANFFRHSDTTVLALTTESSVFRAVYRRLQSVSGDGVPRGLEVFLNATFDNQDFFGGVLGLHELLNELPPSAAVSVGVQIDLDRVPAGIVAVLTGSDFAAKQAALEDPAVTRALIKAGAVIGVRGFYDDPASDRMSSAGITCALCHIRVEPTAFQLAPGAMTELPIGPMRLDGVPNFAMDAGAILALTPFAQNAGQATVDLLNSWGPGRFDVRALPQNVLDDGVNNPTTFPPLWNFIDLVEQDYRFNWDGLFGGGMPPGNALASQAEAVYDLVMRGNGAFGTDSGTLPPELTITPPPELLAALRQAEADRPGNVIPEQALLDVQTWQRSLVSPPPGEFDETLAEAGFRLFYGEARCSACHQSAEFTGPGLFTGVTPNPPEGGLAAGIKVPGLRGIAQTAPYFHDGSAATLDEVLGVYSGRVGVPVLTAGQRAALVEYLKSL